MADLALGARLRLRVFGVDPDQASMERNGFTPVDERAREQLERIALTFLEGYHVALREPDDQELARELDATDAEFRGFAYEGAAMGLTVLDAALPTRRRLRSFLRGPGFPYAWMAPIGFGWARAQMRRRPYAPIPLVDPLLDWFAIDGAGFHDGYFHTERFVDGRYRPSRLVGTAARVYDQGVGRSLWFVRGADVERVHTTIDGFPPDRRPCLWSGVASAATYAGGVNGDALVKLRELAGGHAPDLAQGAAFAVKARLAGGNMTPHAELASRVFCGTAALDAARRTDAALEGIRVAGHDSPYDAWRLRVRGTFAGGEPKVRDNGRRRAATEAPRAPTSSR